MVWVALNMNACFSRTVFIYWVTLAKNNNECRTIFYLSKKFEKSIELRSVRIKKEFSFSTFFVFLRIKDRHRGIN